MKALMLSVICVAAGALHGVEKTFDPRIDAWAFGTVWGIDEDKGVLSIQGQLSDTALEYSKRVEAALKDSAQHDAARFEALQKEMSKLAKREISVDFDKAAPLTLFQCPVKIPKELGDAPPKVVLTDLKIGDVVLIGYDAGPRRHTLLAVVLVQNFQSVEQPGAAPAEAKK